MRTKKIQWATCVKVLLRVLLLYGLLFVPFSAYAQDYSFSLDKEVVDVWVNQDGSINLDYWFTFTCDPGAHPIDVVDVGLPNTQYQLSNVSAYVDGIPAIEIEKSDYVDGVAVWLGSKEISPGAQGTVHVVIKNIGRMLYEDSEDANYASIQFSPTWFDGQFVHGTTDMTVRFHLPPGVQPEEPRWHESPSGWPQEQPDAMMDDEGRVLYNWRHSSAAPDRQYLFGASFPKQYVAEGAVQAAPSGFEVLLGAVWGFMQGCCCNPLTFIVLIAAGIVGFSVWGERRRKMQYLPPSMKIEGVGVKRGLSAVEAAILLETPLNKVLTMILFGLLKKEAITVLRDDPLKVQVNEPLPEELHAYEEKFLEAVKKDGALSESKLRTMMVGLVKTVNKKMKGFSRKETTAYYRDIVNRAWKQVEETEAPEVRSQRFNEDLEWTMLDDDFDDRTRRVFHSGPVYAPVWWGYYRPWAAATSAASSSGGRGGRSTPSSGKSQPISLPTLPGAAFAANVVRGVERTAGNIVGNVTSFTGGVTNVTNPLPKSSSSGGRSSGGGSSCACACACAGCACACAGGGR